MESGGKTRIVPGSQEVIGSIPICSTKRIEGLETSEFATLFSFVYSPVPLQALAKERFILPQ